MQDSYFNIMFWANIFIGYPDCLDLLFSFFSFLFLAKNAIEDLNAI